jgi:hypothetical protein
MHGIPTDCASFLKCLRHCRQAAGTQVISAVCFRSAEASTLQILNALKYLKEGLVLLSLSLEEDKT